MARTPPADFVATLKHRFGAQYDVRWSDTLHRWEILGPSPDGQVVAQTWGWYVRRDPHTGQLTRVPPDEQGLPPFRDLDADAQAEILANMERSFVGNRHDGGTVASRFKASHRTMRAQLKAKRRARAVRFADLLTDARTERPLSMWKKHHPRAKGPSLVVPSSSLSSGSA